MKNNIKIGNKIIQIKNIKNNKNLTIKMKKIIIILLFLLLVIASCEQEMPKKGPFCGDNICQDNEKESGCAADCGGLDGMTKKQCIEAKGKWNDCGSPCAGTDAEFCIQVCSAQCECDDAKYKCPEGYKCRLSGKIKNEIGVCVKG